MRKLTFERAVLVVFIVIILISTSEVTGKYINKIKDRLHGGFKPQSVSVNIGRSAGFPTMLMAADNLFKEGDYEVAIQEYLKMTLNNTLSIEQKTHAYFRMGVSQYNLGKYDLALDSFSKVIGFNPNDSVAYNNAAICAYWSKDLEKAIELENKALNIMPAVEYYYNIARMYEDNEEYNLAAKNYLLVAKGEQNITEVKRIDPVRVKERVARLLPQSLASDSSKEDNAPIVYKLNDTRNILILNENEMEIKKGDFTAKVEGQKDSKNIIAQYNKKMYDPYNLISELVWTVFKDGKQVFKKTSDKIEIKVSDTGIYEIRLNIKYNTNKEMISRKVIKVTGNSSTIGNSVQDDVTVNNPTRTSTKTYEYALYEQLFESDFAISDNGYTDKFNVVWGKDDINTYLNKKLMMDKSSSLVIDNSTTKDGGIWVNLDSLLDKRIRKGRNIKVGFYARKITDNADIDLTIRVKSETTIATFQKTFDLDYRWDQKVNYVYIPQDATGFTISIKTKPGEQINIDGFTLVD